MPAAILWLQLAASAALILGGALYLTRASDVIARRTGLGHTFAGMILLATATSLPELGTGVSAIGLQDAPDLAAGTAFGSNLVNILIIGLADLVWRQGPMLGYVSRTAVLVAVLGAGVIAIASIATVVHNGTSLAEAWYFSPLTGVLLGFFLFSTFVVYRYERASLRKTEAAREGEGEGERETDGEGTDERDGNGEPLPALNPAIALYLVSALVIIASSIWLSYVGDRLADTLGWDETFVGTQFLAISTSLPEMATTLAALRLGLPELAVGNLLGSNLFNMGFILAADELTLTGGTIWSAISRLHAVTGLAGLAMTAVVVAAILYRSRRGRRPGRRWARPEAYVLIAMYVGASVGLFYAA